MGWAERVREGRKYPAYAKVEVLLFDSGQDSVRRIPRKLRGKAQRKLMKRIKQAGRHVVS